MVGEVSPFICETLFDGELGLSTVADSSLLSCKSRNGFLDVGRSGATVGKVNVPWAGEGTLLAGEVARFRKGLFDARLVPNPSVGGCSRSGLEGDRQFEFTLSEHLQLLEMVVGKDQTSA